MHAHLKHQAGPQQPPSHPAFTASMAAPGNGRVPGRMMSQPATPAPTSAAWSYVLRWQACPSAAGASPPWGTAYCSLT